MFQNIINNLYTPNARFLFHSALSVYVILYYSVVVHDILNNVEETCNNKISDKVLGYFYLISETLFLVNDLSYKQIAILIHIITCIFVVISLVIIKKNKVSRKNW